MLQKVGGTEHLGMFLVPELLNSGIVRKTEATPAPAHWALVPQPRGQVLGMSPEKHDTPPPPPAGVFSFHPNPFIQRGREKRVGFACCPCIWSFLPSDTIRAAHFLSTSLCHWPSATQLHDSPPALLSLGAARTRFYSERLVI